MKSTREYLDEAFLKSRVSDNDVVTLREYNLIKLILDRFEGLDSGLYTLAVLLALVDNIPTEWQVDMIEDTVDDIQRVLNNKRKSNA